MDVFAREAELHHDYFAGLIEKINCEAKVGVDKHEVTSQRGPNENCCHCSLSADERSNF